jgi:hypothetical protein
LTFSKKLTNAFKLGQGILADFLRLPPAQSPGFSNWPCPRLNVKEFNGAGKIEYF